MIKIAIVVGSTRPGRHAPIVARWVNTTVQNHPSVVEEKATAEIVDIADFDLPLLDEPVSPRHGDYRRPHTLKWSATIAEFDGFIFVTPEYNHSFSAALKNAIDFLFAEWADKAAGFVSYGGYGGVRAVEQLRVVLAETKTATVRTQVLLSKYSDLELFTDQKNWVPAADQVNTLNTMFGEIIAWAGALKPLRSIHRKPEGLIAGSSHGM